MPNSCVSFVVELTYTYIYIYISICISDCMYKCIHYVFTRYTCFHLCNNVWVAHAYNPKAYGGLPTWAESRLSASEVMFTTLQEAFVFDSRRRRGTLYYDRGHKSPTVEVYTRARIFLEILVYHIGMIKRMWYTAHFLWLIWSLRLLTWKLGKA